MLNTIKQEEVSLMQENLTTKLALDDYDWMQYILESKFYIESQGLIEVKFDYFGTTVSIMSVTQTIGEKVHKYAYKFDSDLFKQYIIKFMQRHIDAWDNPPFNGDDLVIDFFNSVIMDNKTELTSSFTIEINVNEIDYEE